jgi:hypothetical protein
MGAEVIRTEPSLFILPKTKLNSGATAIGSSNFVSSVALRETINVLVRDSKKQTWLVCPHLSEPDLVYKYYIASGLITIVLGKCLCDVCLEKILLRGDLSEFLKTSRPMTDKLFQENVIAPLMNSNYTFTKIWEYISDNDPAPRTWISCSHVSTEDGLKYVYSNGEQLFIFESYCTCRNCFEKIPTNSLVDLLYEGEPMTDSVFQEKIIDPLYPINNDSLEAMGHLNMFNKR